MSDRLKLLVKPAKQRFKDLNFCFRGYEVCDPLHSFGPAVRANYLIHFITAGKGVFYAGNQSYKLGAGDGFLIEPDTTTFYQADALDPWTYFWIGFDGDMAGEIISKIGLGNTNLTFRSTQHEEIGKIILEIINHSTMANYDELMIESLLYRFMAVISKDITVMGSERIKGNEYVRQAVEYMQANYSKPIHIQEVADYVNINRGYLYSLFKEELNMSPQEYLRNVRLTRASEQLNITDLPVETIAAANGYPDPAVFTKAFKKMHGLSPTKYRKRTEEISNRSMIEEGEGQSG